MNRAPEVEQEDLAPQLLRSFKGHKDKITQVVFNPNLKQVISASNDGMVMTWGLRPNTRPSKFIGHTGAVYDVSVNPSGTQIASCSKDNTVRLWNNNA
jgi:WD40 repeat protein